VVLSCGGISASTITWWRRRSVKYASLNTDPSKELCLPMKSNNKMSFSSKLYSSKFFQPIELLLLELPEHGIVLQLLFFTGTVFLLLSTSTCSPPISDLSTVSGYYGIGAVLAWFFTAVAMILTCEARESLQLAQKRIKITIWGRNRNTTSLHTFTASPKSKLDVALISVVSFPTVAAIDFMRRQGNTTPDPQLEASLATMKLFLIVFYFATIIGPRSLHTTRRTIWLSAMLLIVYSMTYSAPSGVNVHSLLVVFTILALIAEITEFPRPFWALKFRLRRWQNGRTLIVPSSDIWLQMYINERVPKKSSSSSWSIYTLFMLCMYPYLSWLGRIVSSER
jgi:lysylphosphatidylglycerol synthetase-like protein (DUF2156 family)